MEDPEGRETGVVWFFLEGVSCTWNRPRRPFICSPYTTLGGRGNGLEYECWNQCRFLLLFLLVYMLWFFQAIFF